MEIGAKVSNGEIITIKATQNVNLVINDNKCDNNKAYEVSSSDRISYTCNKILGKFWFYLQDVKVKI